MTSPKDGESDQGSSTPSECVESDEHSERDSDYESEEEAGFKNSLNIHWTGCGRKTPVILFNPECIFNRRINMRTVGERYHMAYKFGNSECKIVRNILNWHGFQEVHPNSSDYNIVWTGCHLKPFTLRSLSEFQKINHFPRSYELTRKDRLFKNIQKMQQMKGAKNFDIVPASYVLPNEYQEFCAAFLKDKGPWIVKPVASSRGRGIFLVNHPDQIPLDENLVVCRYVHNPLLIDGFKFDVRLYVAVTSYDPIQIYLYEEGLTRFATVKYEKNLRHMRNQCMHLTNYSINKKNEEYVKNDDADVEDYGNKWSLGAMLRYLRSNGKDTAALMMKIEECIIKAIISVEMPIATACKMFMPFKGNCFELYGFDILIDENMKPWVLEVNLSPSLACDSPLDLKIKGYMLCDLFSMTGLICHDPMMRTMQQSKHNLDVGTKMVARAKSARVHAFTSPMKQRPSSAGSAKKNLNNQRDSQCSFSKSLAGLNSEEICVVRKAREEDSRKRGWVRIFPTADTWDLYSGFLQFSTTYNLLLHQKLFPERHKGSSTTITSKGSTTVGSRPKSAYIQLANNPSSTKHSQELIAAYASALTRTKRYERKLGMHGGRSKRKERSDHLRKERRKLVQGVHVKSGEENENENEDNEEQEEDEPPITERNISESNNPKSKQMPAHLYISNSEEVIQIVKEQDSESDSNIDRKANLSASSNTSSEENSMSRTNAKNKEAEIQELPKVPLSPPEPKYNVVDLLQEGHSMSKVQARTAFAMYLVRVQQRLITNSNSMTQDDVDGLNEQMDLVLRFLKRATMNLQQPFKVIVPSRKLPLLNRQRILAKQLGDFVHIYNKETEHLHPHQLEKKQKQMLSPENMKGLDEEKFDRFVHTSSERELEEVLTTYTRINKSASIFLGGKSPSEVLASQHVPTTGNSMQHVGATSASIKSEHLVQQNRHKNNATLDQPSTQPKILTGWEDVSKAIHSVPTSSSDLRIQHISSHTSIHGSTSGNQCYQQRPATYSTTSANSYATAVQIYTQKLSSSLRPKSAAAGGQKSEKQLKSRPASAHMPRPMSSASIAFDSVSDLQDTSTSAVPNISPKRSSTHFGKCFARNSKDFYNDKVISEALQQLTIHQQARQYSAFNGTRLVPSDTANRPTSAYGFHEKLDAHRAWPVYENNSTQSATSAQPSIIGERSQEGQLYKLNSGKCITLEDHIVKSIPSSTTSYKRVHSAIDVKSQDRNKQTNVTLQSANATFDSFIEDTSWKNELAMAYSQVTGVTPQNYHTPSQSSKQYQILQQQAALKQQSKVLLEQSKAKHQAQVAQAHAVQKSMHKLERPESEAAMTQIYAPKPPIRPGSRKAVNAFTRLPRRAVTEETSLNFQFNTSSKPNVKPNVNGGW